MCGIVGSVVRTGFAPENSSSREKALSLISHRGPDARGECTRGSVWFGHTRLSILDLSESGSQPMLSEDGRFAITYNGEVYNYRDLASSLELTDLHSTCDTEVVLRSFAQIGSSAFRQLNGMFAFALHDQETHTVWLVRDRLGIKPLYYYLDHERLVFASELRALITLLGHTPECNIDGLHEWMFYGNSLGERTLYKNICQLLPGHFLHLDANTFESKSVAYWSLKDASALSNQTKDSTKQLIVSTRRLLESAVQRQLISDVPVGVFLSGGIDSSAITAFAARHYKGRLATFAAGFDDPLYPDERPKARQVAEHFGTDHHELFIEGREIAGVVETLIDHHGMPFFDAANIPLYLMAKKVSGEIKVVLQGDGGDEVFGGYRRYASLRIFFMLLLV
jgi:asparagine synthase (glutamine-hydrolysing)